MTVGLTAAQTVEKNGFKVRLRGEQIFVKYQGGKHLLDINDKVEAAKLTDATLLFANQKDGFIYLVIDVCGQSKVVQDDRQCGAGTECNLLWIKLDSDWKIADINSVRYESCWSSITSDDGYKINSQTLFIEFDNFRDDVKTKLFYNAEQPEIGFQIEQKAIGDSN
jgi:hypothetical protein